jgi:nitrogen fixation protein
MFNKLGTKTIVVVDNEGRYVGTILKKGWLKFLKEIEEH